MALAESDVKDMAYISPDSSKDNSDGTLVLEETDTIRTWGPLKLRAETDSLPQTWWFASTAIPLIAATIGPLSNVLSIAAIVTPWRLTLPDNGQLPDGTDDAGVGIADPQWEIILNSISLVCGYIGNIYLLANFTGSVRYITALPLSILFWIMSALILIATTSALHIHAPPIEPGEIYSQGFWHAVLAATLYMLGAVMLMANMIGYFLGHYPQRFELDEDQRTLIVQTMMFFFWLAAGAGVFCKLEGFSFADALYYADVSVLTIGFGDFYPLTDAGRGFLFLYEILGIVQLGLVIASISRFVASISADKVVKAHQKHVREMTLGRTVTNEDELRERLGLPRRRSSSLQPVLLSSSSSPDQAASEEAATRSGVTAGKPAARTSLERERQRKQYSDQYGKLEVVGHKVTFHEGKAPTTGAGSRGGAGRKGSIASGGVEKLLSRDAKLKNRESGPTKSERKHRRHITLLLLKEEKDRFDAMREIQDQTKRFKQYWSLAFSVLAFGCLWCLGACVFYFTEQRIQGLTYFQQLYFCFVSLLTIGYGDMSPKSNIGRPFFIVWSLIAVPTMTVLVNELSSTVVSAINHWSFTVADLAMMPQKGVFKHILNKNPGLRQWLLDITSKPRSARQKSKEIQLGRLEKGIDPSSPTSSSPAMNGSSEEMDPDADLAQLMRSETFNLGRTGGVIKSASPSENRKATTNIKQDLTNTTTTTTRNSKETEDNYPLLPTDPSLNEHDLARHLSLTIRRVAQDLILDRHKKYPYEQWVRFTRLIRFSHNNNNNNNNNDDENDEKTDNPLSLSATEEQRGLVEWDWLGEDSPMLADITEAEWVLDRLCESLARYTRRQSRVHSVPWNNRKTQRSRDELDLPPDITEAEDEEAHARAYVDRQR